MEHLRAAAHREDGRPLRPLPLPRRLPAEPEPDLARAGGASVRGGRRLRSKRGDVRIAELDQFAESGSNREAQR